jgi:hypothetical protein
MSLIHYDAPLPPQSIDKCGLIDVTVVVIVGHTERQEVNGTQLKCTSTVSVRVCLFVIATMDVFTWFNSFYSYSGAAPDMPSSRRTIRKNTSSRLD